MILDDWENAKTVGYFEVGQEPKEEANVIDYNINGEQTKDEFAKLNANNQTTTGMANTIPGVNAPKLLANTSVIGAEGGGGGGGGGGRTSYCELTIGVASSLPAGSFNYFDNLSIDVASSDVTLDDDKETIRLTSGIFILFVMVHIHKSSASFTINSNYWYPNYDFDRIISGNGVGNNYNCYCGVLKSEGNGYVRVGISPTEAISNLTNSKIRLVKIG